MFGTIGTLLTFIVTSPIVEKKGLYTTLFSANIFYGVVFLLSILIYINTKFDKLINIKNYIIYIISNDKKKI